MGPSSPACSMRALLVALQSCNRENTISIAAADGTHNEFNNIHTNWILIVQRDVHLWVGV